MAIKKLDEIIEAVKIGTKPTLIAVSANDEHTISAVNQAVKLGLINAVLVGDLHKISQIFEQEKIDLSSYIIVDEPDDRLAAVCAVELINKGEGNLLMKGLISTDKFIKAILDKEKGLLFPGNILTHVTIVENSNYHKLLIVSDVAILPQPELSQKIQQIKYMADVCGAIGIKNPKVAVIAPSEQVLLMMESSKDAALLAKMNERGQIPNCIVDGPMALDVAIDSESADLKGVKSVVAGDADCLLFPNLDSGNVFYKTNMKLAGAESAAILTGAKVPVVLSSRGDSTRTKLYSIALAALLSKK